MSDIVDGADIVDILWRVHNAPADGHASALSNPPLDRALSLAEGQQLQLELLQRWLDSGEHIGGWKIGMTSGANRNAMGDGIRPFGFILASRIKTAADQLSVGALNRGQIENELCFLIGSELGQDSTREDAMQAVAAVVPAFEINQKRLPGDASTGLRVADDLSNWGIAIGEPVPPPEDLSALTVTLKGEHGTIEQVASAGHIDDHYESLATLARGLAEYGHALQPGQYVITGAYGKTPFAAGTYNGEFDLGIGTVTVNLTP
jgi:2-keto-4-pentenoate hydratase